MAESAAACSAPRAPRYRQRHRRRLHRVRLLDIDFHLFLSGWIGLIIFRPLWVKRILGGRRNPVRYQRDGFSFRRSCRKVSVLRAGPNEVAAEHVHEVSANID